MTFLSTLKSDQVGQKLLGKHWYFLNICHFVKGIFMVKTT